MNGGNGKSKQSKNIAYTVNWSWIKADGLDKFLVWQEKKKTKTRIILGFHRIRGVNGELKIFLKDKMKLWKEYEQKLLNEENESSNRKLCIIKNEGLLK